MTTQRGEDPATGLPEDDTWFTRPLEAPDDAPPPLPAAPGATRAERRRAQEAAEAAAGRPFADAFTESPSGTQWRRPTPATPDAPGAPGTPEASGASGPGTPGASGPGTPGASGPGTPGASGSGALGASGRHVRAVADSPDDAAAQSGAPADHPASSRHSFDPGNTGTWRVRDVVPGVDGGRRTTTILRYLLGLLAIDHVRALTRWVFGLPVVGLLLLLVHPRWIGLAVIALGLVLIVGRLVAVRLISRRTLPRRYRPVEDELRAAVEAGKANLRGELRRVGMPSSALTLPRSVVLLGSSDSRSTARSRLRDIEIDRVLPRAQLDRALRVLDQAPAPR